MADNRMRRHAFGFINAAVLFVTLALCASAHAECVTPAQWQESVLTRSQGVTIAVHADVSGQDALDLVAQMNARPPTTDLAADHILVLSATDLKTSMPMAYMLVAFFNQGCLAASSRARGEEVRALLEKPGEGV